MPVPPSVKSWENSSSTRSLLIDVVSMWSRKRTTVMTLAVAVKCPPEATQAWSCGLVGVRVSGEKGSHGSCSLKHKETDTETKSMFCNLMTNGESICYNHSACYLTCKLVCCEHSLTITYDAGGHASPDHMWCRGTPQPCCQWHNLHCHAVGFHPSS